MDICHVSGFNQMSPPVIIVPSNNNGSSGVLALDLGSGSLSTGLFFGGCDGVIEDLD